MKNSKLDKVYRDVPLGEIPWNFETPPKELIELVESKKVEPCKAMDLGCGAGNYAIYLAGKGFEVTGIDNSPTAIQIARENAKKRNLECDFLVGDVLSGLDEVRETFDFVYDWQLLHHIYPDKRPAYCESVNEILNTGGKYLSVCFSEEDPQFGGSGKYRKTPHGTTLYFSSEKELENLFGVYFHIEELKIIEIAGKSGPHLSVYVFMTKD